MGIKIQTIWSELDHRLIKDGQGRLRIAENVDAVLSSIDNILRTRKGERVMIPSFGSDLASMIFEPVNATAIKFMTRTIKDDIERWDNRVIIQAVDVSPDPDNSVIYITILFQISGLDNIFKYETEVKGEG